ncbi:MAG: glycosyltransferase family 2 protein [Clostridia bacterium]|nr:glycosyltransferase family 2 protein [Clostridia bacterium]
MSDLISVIIPMYNTELYIEKTLNCLRNQTYQNLQIIVVNDGSTDHSLEIVRESAKKDDRIEIINTKNCGVSAARNIGLENVRGEYIIFLDSDDYIEPDMYEKMLAKIKEKNVDMVRCNFVLEDIGGNKIKTGNMYDLSNRTLNNEEIRKILLPYIFDNKIEMYTPLILVKTDIIKRVSKFHSNIHMMEDLLFCLELFLNIDTVYFFDIELYHYVYHSSSSSKSRKRLIMNFHDTLKVVELVEKIIKDYNINESILEKVYHVYSTMIIKYTLRTFQKDDEFKLSYSQMKDLVSSDEVHRIIENVNFLRDNIYIKTSGEFIKHHDYQKLYQYAESIKDIPI